jgi:hypothetical protein
MQGIASVARASRSLSNPGQVTRKYPSRHHGDDYWLADSENWPGAHIMNVLAKLGEDDARQQLIDIQAVVAPLLLFLRPATLG